MDTPTTSVEQWGTKYTKILQRQLQEDNSLLEPYFTVMQGCEGKEVNLPFISKANMSRITSPYQDIDKMDDQEFGNLVMRPIPFYNVSRFSNDEKIYNNNIDFSMSNIITEVRAAANRQRDEVLLGVQYNTDDMCYRKVTVGAAPANPYAETQGSGLLGTQYTGLQGLTLNDLPDADNGDELTTNVVDYKFKYTGTKEATGILLEKIVRGIELLKKRKSLVRGATTAVLGLTARQIAEIQLWESAQNKNYGFGDLVNGYGNKILGVNIMETEMLPIVDVDGKKVRVCPMWIKEHAIYGVWKDVSIRVTPQVERGINYGQVVTQLSLGATRKYAQSVIQIQCLEELPA